MCQKNIQIVMKNVSMVYNWSQIQYYCYIIHKKLTSICQYQRLKWFELQRISFYYLGYLYKHKKFMRLKSVISIIYYLSSFWNRSLKNSFNWKCTTALHGYSSPEIFIYTCWLYCKFEKYNEFNEMYFVEIKRLVDFVSSLIQSPYLQLSGAPTGHLLRFEWNRHPWIPDPFALPAWS